MNDPHYLALLAKLEPCDVVRQGGSLAVVVLAHRKLAAEETRLAIALHAALERGMLVIA